MLWIRADPFCGYVSWPSCTIQPAADAVDTVAVVTLLYGCTESAESTVVADPLVVVSLELRMGKTVELLHHQNPRWVQGGHRREYFRSNFLAVPCSLSTARISVANTDNAT